LTALLLGKCRLVQKPVPIAMPHSILSSSDLRKELAKFYEKSFFWTHFSAEKETAEAKNMATLRIVRN
jgi:hypothetical protein